MNQAGLCNDSFAEEWWRCRQDQQQLNRLETIHGCAGHGKASKSGQYRLFSYRRQLIQPSQTELYTVYIPTCFRLSSLCFCSCIFPANGKWSIWTANLIKGWKRVFAVTQWRKPALLWLFTLSPFRGRSSWQNKQTDDPLFRVPWNIDHAKTYRIGTILYAILYAKMRPSYMRSSKSTVNEETEPIYPHIVLVTLVHKSSYCFLSTNDRLRIFRWTAVDEETRTWCKILRALSGPDCGDLNKREHDGRIINNAQSINNGLTPQICMAKFWAPWSYTCNPIKILRYSRNIAHYRARLLPINCAEILKSRSSKQIEYTSRQTSIQHQTWTYLEDRRKIFPKLLRSKNPEFSVDNGRSPG